MKAKEVRELAAGELTAKLEELYQESFNLRLQRATRQLSNTARFGQVRKDVARIKTRLRELELGEA